MIALKGAVGIAGLASLVFFAHLVFEVLHGPGDDNPIISLFALAALLSLVPAWGLFSALNSARSLDGDLVRDGSVRATRAGEVASWMWLLSSLGLLAALGVLAVMFW